MQNMVLVSWAQLFKLEVVDVAIEDHIIKTVGKLKSIIKTSGSSIMDGDC